MSRAIRALSALLAALTGWALWLISRYLLSIGATRRHHVESLLIVFFVLWLVRFSMLPKSGDAAAIPERRFEWAVLVLGIGVASALFWPTLSLGFLSDDFVLADWARRGDFASRAHAFVRPVPLLLWRLLFDMGGGPGLIHATAVLLHGINAALTVLVCRRLGLGWLASAVAGLLFTIWPTQVEAVAWPAAMPDVLLTTLVLGIVLGYIQLVPRPTIRRAAALTLATVVALFVKETAVAIPAILLTVAALGWRRERPGRLELTTLAAVAASTTTYAAWRLFVRPAVDGGIRPTLTRYVLKEQLTRTFGSLALPLPADTIASLPWIALTFGCASLMLVAWPMIATDRRRPSHGVVVAAGVWCLAATAPAVGYFFIGDHLEGSRYLYLPMAGWAILLAACWQAAATRDRWMVTVGGAAFALLSVLSWQQAGALVAVWREAAVQRDRILQQADAAVRTRRCRVVHFSHLPETSLGAQLFRNGFEEAFQPLATLQTDGPTCDLTWTGTEFR